jgi:hypothetical protein
MSNPELNFHPMPPQAAFPPAPPARTPGPVKAASVLLYVYSGVGLLGALVLAAGGAISSSASDVPIAGMYASRVAFYGFGGAALLALLAAVDIVLGVVLARGRRWAQLSTVGLSAVVGVVSLASPLAPVCIAAALAVIVLVVVPRTARRHFATSGSGYSPGSPPRGPARRPAA